jgi:hypothetical protein
MIDVVIVTLQADGRESLYTFWSSLQPRQVSHIYAQYFTRGHLFSSLHKSCLRISAEASILEYRQASQASHWNWQNRMLPSSILVCFFSLQVNLRVSGTSLDARRWLTNNSTGIRSISILQRNIDSRRTVFTFSTVPSPKGCVSWLTVAPN